MNISKLLSTEKKLSILNHIIFKIQPFLISNIGRELNISDGYISKYFNSLTQENILAKSVKGFVVQENRIVEILKILLNLISIDTKIFKKYSFIKSVGLYGSMVKGKNTELSDIDMWILITNTEETKLAKLTQELKKKYSKINPLLLTPQKIQTLKKEDPVFYYSLYFGSIIIWGEGLEHV